MKIILIDDNSSLRKPLAIYLVRPNHQVIEAESGEHAIQVFNTNPDVGAIITDLQMEETDSGLKVLRHISSASWTVRLCLMSGTLTNEVIREAESLGAVVLAKPFEFSDLRQKLGV